MDAIRSQLGDTETEQTAKSEPNWVRVERMVKRYGGKDLPKSWRERQPAREAA